MFLILSESEMFLMDVIIASNSDNSDTFNSFSHANNSDLTFLLSRKYLHFLDNHAGCSKDSDTQKDDCYFLQIVANFESIATL